MRCITASITIILILSFFPSLQAYTTTFTDPRTLSVLPVHNLDTNISYATIQEAIDDNATTDGHTILVDSGVYGEDIVVNKSIRLIGENRTDTIIEGFGYEEVVRIRVSNATLSGFTVRNGWNAVSVSSVMPPRVTGVNVSNNLLMNSTVGLSITSAGECCFDGNEIVENEIGVYGSSNNSIFNNAIAHNFLGVCSNPNNVWRNNSLASNTYNLGFALYFLYGVSGNTYEGTVDIDNSNTINGKPIYLICNQSNLLIEPTTFPQIGYLGLISCSNVTVRNSTLSDNGEGAFLFNCVNCTLDSCTFRNNLEGIYSLANSTTLQNNIVLDNLLGVMVQGFNDTIRDNAIMDNTIELLPYRFPEYWPGWLRVFPDWILQMISLSSGIALFRGGNHTVSNNRIADNYQGIFLWSTEFNAFRANNVTGSVYNLAIDPTPTFPPKWYSPPVSPQISPYFMQDIDASNTVDGKPVYWLISANNLKVPEDAGYVALINATQVTIQNLALQNNTQGILLIDATNVTVTGNTVRNAMHGIFAASTIPINLCGNNTLELNNITDSGVGVYSRQPKSEISSNYLAQNLAGIYDGGNDSLIRSNVISDNSYPPKEEFVLEYLPLHMEEITGSYGLGSGLVLGNSNSTISGNTISYNEIGINADPDRYVNNTIFNNNFINNIHLLNPYLYPDTSVNKWDGGYPAGGNHWGEYESADVLSGQYQNETGSDGIADNPRSIVWNKTDNYPLMAPIKIFRVETQNNTFLDVSVISNSTISNFQLESSSKIIRFDVFGEYEAGFCRLDVPTQILDEFFQGNYTVFVDGNPVEFKNWTDEAHTYIYFIYRHSEHEITIIPEFQLLTPLLIIMATAAMALIAKRKLRKKASSAYL